MTSHTRARLELDDRDHHRDQDADHDRDQIKAAIIDGLNRMAAQLDIPLLAEGIESREELAELERLGVPLGQGYLFGEPSPSFTGEPAAG